MIALDCFSPDYFTARNRFREAASRIGWELETHDIGVRGPKGEELTVDVAVHDSGGHDDTLVVSSGVHGVEGFFGAAVQLGLMEQWARGERRLPPLRLVFIHSLNPYGFAWLRRGDDQNVDLNRNFLLPGEAYSGSPEGYARVHGFLNPPQAPSRWEPYLVKALWAIARSGGLPKIKHTIASGQYDYPRGLFYGGSKPALTNDLLSGHLRRWLGGSRRVVHLDFHTGLGKSGTWKLLLDHPPTEEHGRQLTDWFGAGTFEVTNCRGVAFKTRGSLGKWSAAQFSDVDYLYTCAEFGTYDPITMLAGLRAENRAHHWASPDDPVIHHAKQRLVELFCPKNPRWRETVMHKSFGMVDLAIQGIVGRAEWR